MKIIDKYIFKEFLTIFLFSVLAFAIIFLSIEALERIETIIEKGVSLKILGLFLGMKLPVFLSQFLPFSVLVATILSVGIMSKRKEILAMKTGGISDYRIFLPYLVLALLFSFLSFIGSEFVSPPLKEQSERLWDIKVKGLKKKASFEAERVWLREDGMIFNAKIVTDKEIQGLTVLFIRDPWNVYKRIDAERALWKRDIWELRGVKISQFGPSGITISRLNIMDIKFPVTLEDFIQGMKEPEEMRFKELYRYVREIAKEGLEARDYLIAFYLRFSYPLSPLVLVMIGLPLSLLLGKRRTGGMPQSIALSAFVGGLYYVTLTLSITLGKGGVIYPWLSAWGPIILFGTMGFYLLESIKH
jgi:lipopolysaccharide export system permease protein